MLARMFAAALPHIRACALALALGLAVGAASAEPDVTMDPVTKMLIDRGLMDAAMLEASTAAPPPTGLRSQLREAASDMVLTAMNFLGVPYKRGGTSAETGFDCSGFTRHIFENSLGLVLPRRADEQARAPGLLTVKRDELKPGDLVFFNTLRRTFSHVGIYVGEGKFIHSPRAGAEVRIEDMGIAYWAKRFTGARRPAGANNAGNGAALAASPGFPAGLIDTPIDVPATPRPYGPRATASPIATR